MHAVDFLRSPPEEIPGVVVLFGDEPLLKRLALTELRKQVLGDDPDGFGLVRFDFDENDKLELRQVLDELSVRSMFGGGCRRLVLVDGAEDFISAHRPKLEAYLDKPKTSGVLVLNTKSFASNTRLYKQTAAKGLALECKAPTGAALTKWLRDWCKTRHKKELPSAAAEALVEIAGGELGLLDQELAKLAVLAGEDPLTPELVQDAVGGWRAKTAWDMLDAAAAGQAGSALEQLDRLITGGENAIALLGQMSYTLRKFAAAARIILSAEARGERPAAPRAALQAAGIKPFVIQKSEDQFRQLGRQRASQIYHWLIDADLALKGDSQAPARMILEQLIVRMSQRAVKPLAAAPVGDARPRG